jgi:hypothetical protein
VLGGLPDNPDLVGDLLHKAASDSLFVEDQVGRCRFAELLVGESGSSASALRLGRADKGLPGGRLIVGEHSDRMTPVG